MTRFARAKGSKASNERIPESATPWKVMKKELIASHDEAKNKKHRDDINKQRQESYDNFIEETEKKQTKKWADFPETRTKPTIKKKQKRKPAKMNLITEADVTDDMIDEFVKDDPDSDTNFEEYKMKIENVLVNIDREKKGKQKVKVKEEDDSPEEDDDDSPAEDDDSPAEDDDSPEEDNDPESDINSDVLDGVDSEKKGKQKVKVEEDDDSPEEDNDPQSDSNSEENKNKIEDVKVEDEEDDDAPEECNAKIPPEEIKLSKSQIRRRKKKALRIEAVAAAAKNDQKDGQENAGNKKQQQNVTKKQKQQDNEKQQQNVSKKQKQQNNATKQQPIDNKNTNGQNQGQKRKLPKERDDKEHKRRKPDLEDNMTIMVNGKLEKIARLDGFPVLKTDAERLIDLRKKLIGKSVPKREVQRTMQLERRKAEKSLSRLKKLVCFQCRKTGHVLSSCPELTSSGGATDICFKCGSTEHTSSVCKSKSDSFKFATCFICRERGHLARECPDNPRGLYPDGGCCKLCGDVTHLKKDCPQQQQKQQDDSVVLDTISSQDLEGLGEVKKETVLPKKKAVVKF